MRPKLDLRSGHVMLALGAAGLGSAGVTAAAGAVGGGAGAPPTPSTPPTVGVAPSPGATGLALNGGSGVTAHQVGDRAQPSQSDHLGISGGALAGLLEPVGPGTAHAAISAGAVRRNVLIGRRIAVSGTLRPGTPGAVIALQERHRTGWATIARARTSGSGRFQVGFRPPAPGTLALRVRATGRQASRPALRALGVVNVYRLAEASWYGPGGSLACGGTLTSSRLGVAHKTLPCGTLVSLHLGNRTVRVPVIDRGPYVSGREYDLTPATKRALGFGDVGAVWASR